MKTPIDVNGMENHLRRFTKDRDWDQYHTPKNLSMALAGEAGELLELFQWLTPEESKQVDRKRAGEELSDILIYAIRMADVLGIDLGAVIWEKTIANSEKYPIEKARGNARKYDEL